MSGTRKSNIAANSDEELMRLSSQGERLAFECLYDRYFGKLVWFARGFVTEQQKAEDLVQEVFIRIIRQPGSFDPKRRFSTWVYTVTGNACRNELRNQKREPAFLDESAAFELPGDEADAGYREEIRMIFRQLTQKEKQVFVLRFEQELSIKEIAEVMSIPEGSVKSCLFYMLKKFAKQLKQYEYEG